MKSLIVSGGRVNPTFLFDLNKKESFHRIIAVDGGLTVLDEVGIIPTDIIGDFDTVSSDLLDKYKKKQGISTRTFPSKKNATDSQLALEYAIEEQSNHIMILGATGTRIDHVLGAISILQLPLKAGVECWILDENNRITLIDKPKVITKKDTFGKYISLLPFTEQVKEISLKGFLYPLENYNMKLGEEFTIGISNELLMEEGLIDFKEGILILIESID